MLLKPEKIAHLPWDSDLFGYPVGTLSVQHDLTKQQLQGLAAAAKAEGFRLVYLKSNAALYCNDAPLEKAQLLLADKKVTYSRPVPPPQGQFIDPLIKPYEQSTPNASLLSLTLQSGAHSRFAVDPNFKYDEFKKLYSIWIEKSVKKEAAKEVFVSQNEDQKITGFITLGLKGDVADIGLLAVDAAERGKSIGKKLVQAAFHSAWTWNMPKIQVVTQQNNQVACSFYEKCGFTPEKTEFIYHLWLSIA